MQTTIYDTVIIGAGPAALSASIYASRYFLKHLVIGKVPGGTMTNAHKIENYPGIESISGSELAEKMKKQIAAFETQLKTQEVKRIRKNEEGIFEITLDKEKVLSHTVILAIGMQRRSLNIPGEKEFLGKGVSYCSTCDAAFFQDKTVVVIGGANAATMAAIHLSEYASQVYLIYRGEALRGEPTWNQRALDNPKIEVIFNTNLASIQGKDQVEKVTLDKPFKNSQEIKTDGVFIEIGLVPATALAIQLKVETTKDGFIKVNPAGETNVKGVLSAGDITNGSNNFRQIVTAVSEGAIAAKTAFDLKVQREQTQTKIDYA